VEKKQGIRLEDSVELWTEAETSAGPADASAGVSGTAAEISAEGTVASKEHAAFRTITIVRGDGGYGGPLTITPTPERHKVLYMTGGGLEPEPLARIVALSGMEAVNGNLETCPDEEVALAIIDCGGTLRCGIYPGKGIPTVNILATGKSGPLAKYMTEDLYVSAVTSEGVSAVEEAEAAGASMAMAGASAEEVSDLVEDGGMQAESKDESVSDVPIESGDKTSIHNFLAPVIAVSKVVSLFQQSAREAVRTCLEMILPFMGFAALFIGICKGSGLTQFLAGLMQPMGGSLPGLMGIGIICSVPGLSAVLGAGAVAAQMFSTVIGELIASGSVPAAMALPALFAINCQCACDFIPVGLGMTEAKPETTQVGIAAVTISRFATGWIRILIALLFSIGLY
jgi:PTS system glucitol/sorbitol-specific IIC component